ncbi:MAG: phosphopyruvate hydratase [Aeriscardovia sp.]|nr:phosphopyruvate hydratase [Aeriscardovia sp.]
MAAIERINARQILDSRGKPTLEVSLETDDGAEGVACVPSGASTGIYEAVEKRDGDSKHFNGKGVLGAIKAVREVISPALAGLDSIDQRGIDERLVELDGTKNKSKLGANAMLGVSMANLRAAAQSADLALFRYIGGVNGYILPVPCMNILNGGAHADNNVDIQEFMIAPYGFDSFHEALEAGCAVYSSLKSILKEEGLPSSVGDEGGFAPNLESNATAIDLILKAIRSAGFDPGKEIGIGIDAASSEFYDSESGEYRFEGSMRSRGWMLDYWQRLVEAYPVVSIEDPFAQDDWDAWIEMEGKMGGKIQIVGDDLLTTNPSRLSKAISLKACNALLVKPNQIGTVSETLDAMLMALRHGFSTMVSHRSGETMDTFISDLAVARNACQIKAGAPARGERVAKYNRLLKIEMMLGESGKYAGKSAFKRASEF